MKLIKSSCKPNNSRSLFLQRQKDTEQKVAISKFLADGLKQLIATQSEAGCSKIMGSLSIPNSLIHIDLAALGITSLSIALNIPDQCDAPPLSPPISNLLMQQNPDDTQFHPQQMLLDLGGAQIHPNMRAPYAYSLGKGNPITRVYYRRRFKSKDFATVSQLNSSDKSKRSISATKKRKCITPTTTMKLRRSPRLIKKLDGHKPASISLKKAPTRNKNKKIKPQSDLLGNILLSPTCQASNFPTFQPLLNLLIWALSSLKYPLRRYRSWPLSPAASLLWRCQLNCSLLLGLKRMEEKICSLKKCTNEVSAF